jgi:hypothetical protein
MIPPRKFTKEELLDIKSRCICLRESTNDEYISPRIKKALEHLEHAADYVMALIQVEEYRGKCKCSKNAHNDIDLQNKKEIDY